MGNPFSQLVAANKRGKIARKLMSQKTVPAKTQQVSKKEPPPPVREDDVCNSEGYLHVFL